MSQKTEQKEDYNRNVMPSSKLYQQNNIISKTEERYRRAINLQKALGNISAFKFFFKNHNIPMKVI